MKLVPCYPPRHALLIYKKLIGRRFDFRIPCVFSLPQTPHWLHDYSGTSAHELKRVQRILIAIWHCLIGDRLLALIRLIINRFNQMILPMGRICAAVRLYHWQGHLVGAWADKRIQANGLMRGQSALNCDKVRCKPGIITYRSNQLTAVVYNRPEYPLMYIPHIK